MGIFNIFGKWKKDDQDPDKGEKGKEMGFFTRKILERQLSKLPKQQRDIMMRAFERNPDFFKKIDQEIKAKKKQGLDENVASMQVMRAHQAEFQKMMMEVMK